MRPQFMLPEPYEGLNQERFGVFLALLTGDLLQEHLQDERQRLGQDIILKCEECGNDAQLYDELPPFEELQHLAFEEDLLKEYGPAGRGGRGGGGGGRSRL